MSSRTPNQEKALAWYCKQHNLKPKLSTHPTYYFTAADGEEHTRHIGHIVNEWNVDRESKKHKKGEGA